MRSSRSSARGAKSEAVESEAPRTTTASSKGKAASTKAQPAKKSTKSSDVKEDVVILKTTTTDENETELKVAEPSSSSTKPKTNSQNHWTEAAETQLNELITMYRSQGYSGPMLWELISRKADFDFTAEQCMSKFYREKTKERYKIQGKKRKEPSTTVKWDAEGTERLNASVELIKSQDFEGSKLWNLVAESLDSKWTAAQCMNKYYRDRHKLQKLKKQKL
mmetsp:Transcript_19965/g.33648  ORF Transcript_19965/g.33648 Transcript_19965/m.33648 type:complete len:221 (+) Transcript_19965:43-705(+)